MAGIFPSEEWVLDLKEYLNSDEMYAEKAKKWEGDIIFDVDPAGALEEKTKIYLDLWHGKCRDAYLLPKGEEKDAAFILRAPFTNFVRVLKGELDPMQAMLTRRLVVKGSMPYMMRNVPTVLEFVRCAQDVTDKVIGE